MITKILNVFLKYYAYFSCVCFTCWDKMPNWIDRYTKSCCGITTLQLRSLTTKMPHYNEALLHTKRSIRAVQDNKVQKFPRHLPAKCFPSDVLEPDSRCEPSAARSNQNLCRKMLVLVVVYYRKRCERFSKISKAMSDNVLILATDFHDAYQKLESFIDRCIKQNVKLKFSKI